MNRIDIKESLESMFPNGTDPKSFNRIVEFFLYENLSDWESLVADLNAIRGTSKVVPLKVYDMKMLVTAIEDSFEKYAKENNITVASKETVIDHGVGQPDFLASWKYSLWEEMATTGFSYEEIKALLIDAGLRAYGQTEITKPLVL